MSVYNELRLNQEFCDAVIRVDNVEFHVHKIILCSSCSFFGDLFTVWSTPDQRDFDISIVTADMMKLIIDFLYTGSVTVTTENVQELFKAACNFFVSGIIEACCSFMEEQLTPQNCIGIWLLTLRHTPEMNRKVFGFIMKHFAEVAATSEEFLLLSADDLVRIIEQDQLNVKQEKMVLEAVLRWITYATEEREEHILDLLSNVRLAFVSPEYLIDFLSNNEHVRASEGFQQIISMNLQTILQHGNERFSDLDRPRLPPAILFAVGGWNPNSSTNGIEAYNVNADCWVTITSYTTPPLNSRTVFHNGSLYVVGGSESPTYFSSLQRFDLSTKTWHELSHMHYRRSSPVVAVLDGYIYAVGGENRSCLRTAERYDPSTNQWTLIAPMSERRGDASGTTLNGKVYICGGFNGHDALSSAECYDPATNQWKTIANMNIERSDHGVIAYAGCVFAVGGRGRHEVLRTAEAYNPHTNTWTEMPSMLELCWGFGIEVIDDRLFVVGGKFFLYAVQCFDINTGQWSKVCPMNSGRFKLSCSVVSGLPNLADYAAPHRSPD